MAFSSRVGLLPVALLSTVAQWASATTFPSTVEVDLVFPHNDSYAPSTIFPIVFAFQNAALAPTLDPGFELSILQNGDVNSNVTYSPQLDLRNTNFSGSDPYYVYTFLSNINTTSDGNPTPYLLQWQFGAGNCSGPASGTSNITGGFRTMNVFFTIQNGAQVPDLTASADTSTCSNISHFAFNVTDTLPVLDPGEKYDGRNTCAVLSDEQPMPSGNPCAVQVGSATASSISAAMTATICAGPSPSVSCPPSKNAGPRAQDPAFRGTTTLLGGLVATLVIMQLL